MIIKQVTIRKWRGIEHFETELRPGLNILRGQNEAGKSSVVEAVSWALHRDLVGGARVKDDIAPIIPAHDPKAKPCVELLLEFPDCTATIRKTLAEDSAQRECCLVVRREGVADQSFDQGAAQNELRRLMMADGEQGSLSTSGVDVSLLVSAQGQSTDFVGQELSSSARSSIVVGEDGAIAPTSRLEKVRVALEKKRAKEMFEKLRANAVDAAKKQTDAAHLRDELAALREEHAKYSAIEAQIAHLRAQIKDLLEEYKIVAPRAENTQKELDDLRARHEAQIVASREVAEKRRVHDEARARRDAVQKRIEEIANLTGESTRVAAEWQQSQSQLETLRESESEWKEKAGDAWKTHESAESEWRASREKLQAWDKYQEVCSANRERRRLRDHWEQLQTFVADVEAKKGELEKLGRAPSRPQISRWREQYFALENARNIAAQSLKITFHFEADTTVEFRADDGQVQSVAASAGEEIQLGAQANLALEIPGVGKLTAATTGREAQKQNAELDAKTRSMEKDLATFGVSLSQLPDALEELENRLSLFEQASQQLQYSEQQLGSALVGGLTVESLREQLEDAEAEYSRARQSCDPLRHHIPENTKPAQANIERERARENEHQKQEAAERARRAWQGSLAKQNEFSKQLATCEARSQALEKARAQIAVRLDELQNDGLDSDARAHLLDDFSEALWIAKGERDTAIKNYEALGAPVSSEVLARVAHEARQLLEHQFRLEKEVGEKRVELRGHCEQDPQTELDRLAYEIESREEEITRHEARLRGLAILEGALEAERHRLGRAIAAPLNEYLSPWLSELRGKKTRVEFDENTGRITGVQTETGGSTHVLPFGSHSGGMQEQTALALRLIIAQASAKKLPSGKLPLVLDDPLTQTDTTRRSGLWRVLRAASNHLQILFVTCHETHLPQSDLDREGVHWVTLGAWPQEWQSTPALPVAESKLPEEAPAAVASNGAKPKRVTKKKAETNGHGTNGHVAETSPETLSLW